MKKLFNLIELMQSRKGDFALTCSDGEMVLEVIVGNKVFDGVVSDELVSKIDEEINTH